MLILVLEKNPFIRGGLCIAIGLVGLFAAIFRQFEVASGTGLAALGFLGIGMWSVVGELNRRERLRSEQPVADISAQQELPADADRPR
jgi:hypothetical protein